MNYYLQFLTQNKEVCFDIEYTENPINNSIINEFINDVRITTYGTKEVEYEGFIVRLDEVAKDRYKDLFAKYTKYNRFKKLLQLKNLIDKSSCNIYMAVIFDKQLSHIQHKEILAYLSELETGVHAEKIMQEYIKENGQFLSVYNPFAISPDTSTVRIGTKQKSNRVCRYCNKTTPDVTFKNKSHTISQALGNICYITNDECDSCNKKFGLSIEQDFTHYVEMFNSLAHDKFRLGSIDFSKNNDGHIFVTKMDEGILLRETDSEILYNYKGSVVKLQNVYRAMCKYAIGFIPSEILTNLKDTIKWINGDYNIESLPIVKKALHDSMQGQPIMNIFIRKDEADQSYPYLFVDFHLNFLEFLFIVPNSLQDKVDFSDGFNYSRFWGLLYPFHNRTWKDVDMSSMNNSVMKGLVTFHKRKKSSD